MAPLECERRAELVASLAVVRSRLADAATSVGRDPRAITVIVVTKTFPATDVVLLADLGLRDFGENRDQEAQRKVAEVARLRTGSDLGNLRWHFVGRLQTNKARSVVRYAEAVHSLDRPELVAALAQAVRRLGRDPLGVFLQVSLDGNPARGGALPGEVPALAEDVLENPELQLRGVMAVAPLGEDPDRAFARLAAVSERVCRVAPAATAISAGMSGDFESAVRQGATHVRIGSALLGQRGAIVS